MTDYQTAKAAYYRAMDAAYDAEAAYLRTRTEADRLAWLEAQAEADRLRIQIAERYPEANWVL